MPNFIIKQTQEANEIPLEILKEPDIEKMRDTKFYIELIPFQNFNFFFN